MMPSLKLHAPDSFNWIVETTKLTDDDIYRRTGINRRRLQHLRAGARMVKRNGEWDFVKIEMTYPEQFILEAVLENSK